MQYTQQNKFFENKIYKKGERLGFTLVEVVVSMALLSMLMLISLEIIDFVSDVTVDNEIASEISTNSSRTKELLLNTLDTTTKIEILPAISNKDLSKYTENIDSEGDFNYLYSINGDVYFRGEGGESSGEVVKMLTSSNIDLEFFLNESNPKILNVDIIFDDNYKKYNIIIAPLNLKKDENIIDNRINKSIGSNIIRYSYE